MRKRRLNRSSRPSETERAIAATSGARLARSPCGFINIIPTGSTDVYLRRRHTHSHDERARSPTRRACPSALARTGCQTNWKLLLLIQNFIMCVCIFPFSSFKKEIIMIIELVKPALNLYSIIHDNLLHFGKFFIDFHHYY